MQWTDEWYSWRVNPRLVPGIRILYTLDEKTFTPGKAMGDDHPIMWTRENPEGGRMVYMGMGHDLNQFKPELDKGYAQMEKLMRACLLWAIKKIPAGGVSLSGPFPAPRRVHARPADARMLFQVEPYLGERVDISGRARPAPAR